MSLLIPQRCAVEMFSNLDGMSLGAAKAGFKTLLHTDISNEAERAHLHYQRRASENDPGHINEHFVKKDIRRFSAAEMKAVLRKKYRIDIEKTPLGCVMGGPPCFGSTRQNPNQRANFHPLNRLMFEYLDRIRDLKPLTAWMEQVPAIFDNSMAPLRTQLEFKLRSMIEYDWDWVVLNAKEYGCFQARERLTLILIHKSLGKKVSFPEPLQLDLSTQSAFSVLGAEQFRVCQFQSPPRNAHIKPFGTLTSSEYEVFINERWHKMTIAQRLKLAHMVGMGLEDVFSESILKILLGMMVLPPFAEAVMTHIAGILREAGVEGWDR